MTRKDIIRMAREAGCLLPGKGGDPNGLWEPNGWENVTDLMFKFAALVAAYEREECAKACENYTDNGGEKFADHEGHGYECAVAIRARGEK
jgi:hypothetical protein